MTNTQIFYSPAYNNTDVAFDTTRKANLVADRLKAHGGFDLIEPHIVDTSLVTAVHEDEYIDALMAPTGPIHEWLAVSNGLGWDRKLWAAVLSSTSGVVRAAQAAWANDVNTGSLSSGLHHAKPRHGDGFCTLNGLAVAAHDLTKQGARVLILDFDAHCGGGTIECLDRLNSSVDHVDVATNWFDSYAPNPYGTGLRRITIVESPDDYLTQIDISLCSLNASDYDVVLYNAGMDPHEWAGGMTGIDTRILGTRETMVYEWAHDYGLPVAFVLAGGYESSRFTLNDVAELHLMTARAAHRMNQKAIAA